MELGDPMRVEMTKWGDRPHWEFSALFLGGDEHGRWFGVPAGTLMARPKASFVTGGDQVGLVPTAGSVVGGGGWVARFYAAEHDVRTYVDMTTVPLWDGDRVHAVDLDLDVVRTAEGHVFVDDEDEFAEHQVAYGYPSGVISLAEESCASVLDAVLAERSPFDGDSSDAWLAALRRR